MHCGSNAHVVVECGPSLEEKVMEIPNPNVDLKMGPEGNKVESGQ